ncbi:class F sortase [Cellulomonas soli]|uniref:Class F sortase n=1 Tax=Cellulomonas soli TaxID=931535 RepID=A0A512PHZ8_9CELL|nr:class F sortase [Cellulomonas soli]NYI58817.1 sortase (surface protein transpeptidase) [Cellulomonas soli]GEP70803.1 hypothetical protein CSO01_35180 [Cellulomonas soli]
MNGERPRAAARLLHPSLLVPALLVPTLLGSALLVGCTPGPQHDARTTSAGPTAPGPLSGPSPAGSTSPAPTTTTSATTLPQADVPVRRSDLGSLTAEPEPAAPARLQVPELGLDMPVDPVGVLTDGTMQVPQDADRAGWYRYGAAPDSPAGSTLLAAHVDSTTTGIGPFARLREATVGTAVQLTTSDGRTHAYRVVRLEQIGKDGAPLEQWFARDGRPLLVLVTCGGAFRRDIGHYTDNVVVTAEPVGSG